MNSILLKQGISFARLASILFVFGFSLTVNAQAPVQSPLQEAATLGSGKGLEIFSNVTSKMPDASTVPGYNGTDQEQKQFFQGGKGQLVGPGMNRAEGCTQANDTECQAVNLIQWGPHNRPATTFSANDPLLTGARQRMANATTSLGTFSTAAGTTAGLLTQTVTQCETKTVVTPATYETSVCDETAQLENKTCTVDQVVKVDAQYDYLCEKTLARKTTQTCNKTLSVTCTSAAQESTCPVGTTPYNGRCRSTSSVIEIALISGYTCPDGTTTKSANDCKTTVNTIAPTTYSCANGTTPSGTGSSSTCTATTTSPAALVTSYSCPTGGELKDGNCVLTTSPTPGPVVFPDAWAKYTPTQKIDWYNANNVTPAMLLAAGVPQSEIDWMSGNGYWLGYSCPNGGKLSGTTCITTTTTPATPKTTYSCANGTTPSGTGSSSTCITTTTSTAALVTSYSCPSGASLSNSSWTCTTGQIPGAINLPAGWAKYTPTQKIDWYNANNVTPAMLLAAGVPQSEIDWMSGNGYWLGYSCPNGGKLSGTTCITTTTTTATPETTYSCANGTTPSGTGSSSTCITTTTAPATPNTSYSCPSGGIVSGSSCSVTSTSTYTATPNTSYSCPSGGNLSGSSCSVTSTSTYTATPNTSYSCPSGGNLSGSSCSVTSTSSYSARLNRSWSCPGGGNVSGTSCVTTSTYTPSGNSCGGDTAIMVFSSLICVQRFVVGSAVSTDSYSCPSGGNLSGSSCSVTSTSTYTATPNTTYSCPSGGNPSGSSCSVTSTSTYTATPNTSYSCPSGGNLSGSSCSVTSTSTYTATPNTTYSCPSGGMVSGSSCVTTTTISATATTTYSCTNGTTPTGFGSNSTCSITTTYTASQNNQLRCPLGFSFADNSCIASATVISTQVCSDGGTPIDGICTTVDTTGATATTTDTCLDDVTPINGTCTIFTGSYPAVLNDQLRCLTGYVLTGNNCVSTTQATASTEFICPTGQILIDGDLCSFTITTPALRVYSCQGESVMSNGGDTSNLICPRHYQRNGSLCTYSIYSEDGQSACHKFDLTGWIQTASSLIDNCGAESGSCYSSSCTVQAKSATDICPTGTVLVGSDCARTTTISAIIIEYSKAEGATCSVQTRTSGAPVYGCKEGGRLNSDNTCTYILTTDNDPQVRYSCPADVTLTETSVLNGVATYSCCVDSLLSACQGLEAKAQ